MAVNTNVRLQAQQQNILPSTNLQKSFMKGDETVLSRMDMLFRNAYYLIKNELPFTQFEKICELHKLNGLNLGERYMNDKEASIFVKHIALFYEDEVRELLRNGDFFSAYCDGSTDRTCSEKECILVRVLEDFYPVIKFLRLVEPPNTKAIGILQAINSAFQGFGMPNYHQKMIGFCTDGASVMTGKHTGVMTRMKEEGDAMWILVIWCLAHKLELAIKDAFKKTYMDNVTEALTMIYYYYKGSPKRNKEVKDIADIIDEQFKRPEKANGTRWVDHKLRAVTKMINNWNLIYIHMSNYVEDHTNRAEDRAKAKGILAKIRQFKFVWYLYFMKDVLNEIAKVSLLLQREDIALASAITKLQACSIKINDLIANKGPQLTMFDIDVVDGKLKDHQLLNVIEPDTLNDQKNVILRNVLRCIDDRFEHLNEEIFVSVNVFDHKNWPDNNNALLQYGKEEVQVIFNHFQLPLTNANCDLVAALNEWIDLKLFVHRSAHFNDLHPLKVWQSISRTDVIRQEYQNILKIVHLTSLYPMSNAACERAFSVMKRIKSDWRANLTTESMDRLMRVDIEGPEVRHFVPRPIVNRWWLEGERTKRA